jgi:2-(1,2-epoxy-1,2-dihydrophenyl)acetyl-CoA isomerase
MSEEEVLTDLQEGVAVLTLNRPAVLNALTTRMAEALSAACDRCEHDSAVRCVVIRGAGEHFMAGGDIKSFHQSLTKDRDNYLRNRERLVVNVHHLIYQLRRMPKPVLASVKGAAAGFGLSLVLAADLAIASDDAVFTLAYRHLGLSADGGATYFLPRVVGERRALELALLGERFTAETAKQLGIVNWVTGTAALQAETTAIARRLADGPTVALGLVKRLIRSSLDNSWDEQSHREAESLAVAAATEDHLEGVTAFVEKRKPAFTGR